MSSSETNPSENAPSGSLKSADRPALIWPGNLYFSIREGKRDNETIVKAYVVDGAYRASFIVDVDNCGYTADQLVDVANFLKCLSAFLVLAEPYVVQAATDRAPQYYPADSSP